MRACFLAALVALSSGCLDGYPTEDVPSIDPVEMTQAQRVARMNELAGRHPPSSRPRIRLSDGCVLEVTRAAQSFAIPVQSMQFAATAGRTEGTFTISIQHGGSATDAVSLMDGAAWYEVVQMRSLLEHLKRNC